MGLDVLKKAKGLGKKKSSEHLNKQGKKLFQLPSSPSRHSKAPPLPTRLSNTSSTTMTSGPYRSTKELSSTHQPNGTDPSSQGYQGSGESEIINGLSSSLLSGHSGAGVECNQMNYPSKTNDTINPQPSSESNSATPMEGVVQDNIYHSTMNQQQIAQKQQQQQYQEQAQQQYQEQAQQQYQEQAQQQQNAHPDNRAKPTNNNREFQSRRNQSQEISSTERNIQHDRNYNGQEPHGGYSHQPSPPIPENSTGSSSYGIIANVANRMANYISPPNQPIASRDCKMGNHNNSNDVYKLREALNKAEGSLSLSTKRVLRLTSEKADLIKELTHQKRYNDQTIQSLHKRVEKLNGDLLAQKAEYHTLFTEFHENVKHIRATDDDLSTIQKNLSNIQTKISNLSMNLKKHLNQDTAKVNEFLLDYWGNTLPNLKYLMKKNLDDGSSEFEYGIINLLVEKMITDIIVQEVYNVPIYLGLPINAHYAALSEWKPFCETKDWSLRLREQLCFLAAKPEITASLKHKRDEISKFLIDLLYQLYPTMGLREQDKIRSFVDLAAENSLAMHSQKIPVSCMKLKEGQDKLQDGMKIQYGSAENATTIQVVVCPPFIGNEGQESSRCVLLEAKVICVDFPSTPPLDPFVDEPPQLPKE